ncbi:heparinase II/III family protein [Pontiellaceae bacterium B12219]|nr:heparinase II/III family protein [Pontiellaceae bacterium B12219]
MNTNTPLKQISIFAVTLLLGAAVDAGHPQLLVTADQQEIIAQKVADVPWANAAFIQLTDKIDAYVAKTQAEPDWAVSRLAMNWETHYEQAITKGSRTIDGKGRAPVPTPRFAGARDWKTDYVRQTPIEALIPYNDKGGKIRLININTEKEEWVDPAITGHAIERINNEMLALAADASFLNWVTGDRKYAEFAAPILWTFMNGLSYTKAPVILDKDGGPSKIIGTTSYEVIHDGILHSIAISYDFLYNYIQENDEIDGAVIEQGIKRITDRIIEGGGRSGNWNLHQAMKIAHGGLALEENAAYDDGKGREYYVDIALNADLPNQLGVIHVIEEGYDPEYAVWPEAPGYAFDTTANIVTIASLLSNDPVGRKALENPVVSKAVLGQLKQMYPSGHSHAMGDTSYTRVDTRALEMMLSWAISEGDSENASAFAAALQAEIDAGKYDRNNATSLLALTRYVDELPEGDPAALQITPTYFAEPINLAMLRNMPENGDVRYALGAAVFGTKGGHMHANGLSVELYGAGYVLGFDSGRGSSYWQADHGEYYRQPPSHNTVIVNGDSKYASHGNGMIQMKVEKVEPAFDQPATDNRLTYLTAGFKHKNPAATQQRTLALVRIDDTTAFYFDVFRSKTDKKDSDQYHDWFYHAMADTMEVSKLKLKNSSQLTSKRGNQKGYDYFSEEKSAETESSIEARFPLQIEGNNVAMDVWVVGEEDRRVFSVMAPANRGARHYVDEKYWNRLQPTMVVRQDGEAWDRPFVAVYEPSIQSDGVKIKSVKAIADDTWLVSGEDWRATLKLDGVQLSLEIEK